jgi:hypothetical protein
MDRKNRANTRIMSAFLTQLGVWQTRAGPALPSSRNVSQFKA